ncbi:MAG: hypothetical protein MUO76_19850, partial [Anaerolineaceae bacterium]|nr:hypothetical protein [Anaerolineaceae bacterium]
MKKVIVCFVVAFLLISCSPAQSSQEILEPAEEITKTLELINTIEPSVTQTPLPTFTSTSIPSTSTPTVISTATFTHTATPKPFALQLVDELL